LRKARLSHEAAPEVAQNLALVLGRRDRFDEAKSAAAGALPAGKVTANVAYLQALRGAKTADAGAEARALNASLGLSFQLGGAN
jgi:Flp pilus assembly protein TadD